MDSLYNDCISSKTFSHKTELAIIKKYIFRAMKPFHAYQNDILMNVTVVMNAVIERADYSKETKSKPLYLPIFYIPMLSFTV